MSYPYYYWPVSEVGPAAPEGGLPPLPPQSANASSGGGLSLGSIFGFLKSGTGIATGLGLLSGIAGGITAVMQRREERERIRRQNKIYEDAAKRMVARGTSARLNYNQGASGQINRLMYANRYSPQVIEAMTDMYGRRINAGMTAYNESLNTAAQLRSQKQPLPSSGRNDWLAGIMSGLGSGVGLGLSTYQALKPAPNGLDMAKLESLITDILNKDRSS